VVGIRYYDESDEGLYIVGEKWSSEADKNLARRIPERKKTSQTPTVSQVADVRLIVHTNPSKVTGVPSKTPEIFEIRIGGSDLSSKLKYADEKLGKEISFSDFSSAGNFVDVIGVTKGKGFQGHVKRFGVKLLPKKNRKHRRMIGTLGPWHPDWVRNTVPQAGQVGTHQRTVHNIRVLRFAKNENEMDVNVKGGYPGYGLIRTDYVLVHGSIPGASKRLIKFREPARQKSPAVSNLNITYVSKESKQGD
jgi:large subunit ribosomal protein L3